MAEITLYNGAYTGPQVDAAISRALAGGAIDTEIEALKAAVGAPLQAATVAEMTDTNKIYVYTGSEAGYTNGNWYYYNGSAWVSGGQYLSPGYTFDDTPTQGSTNPVKSGGVFSAIQAAFATASEQALAAYATDTASGSVATFPDGADGIPVKSLVAQITPVQDLNGYDAPWPAGGGKNKLGALLSTVKTLNTSGTWNGDAYTFSGVTFTFTTTSDGYIVSVIANGTATANTAVRIGANDTALIDGTAYIMSGCPTGGGQTTYQLGIITSSDSATFWDNGSGYSFTLSGAFTRCECMVRSGYTANNLTFYPMIRLSTEADATFAPYSNICPITGWTGANVTQTGKNLIISSITSANVNSSGKITSSNDYDLFIAPIKTGVDYVITDGDPGGALYAEFATLPVMGDTAPNGRVVMAGDTFTATMDGYVVFRTTHGYATPMIEVGTTATTYVAPITPTTYTVSWTDEAGTVYDGTAEYIGGGQWQVTPTMAVVDLGTLNWSRDTTTRPVDGATIHAFYAVLSDCKRVASIDDTVPNMLSSVFAPDTVKSVDYGGNNTIKDNICSGADANARIWFYGSIYNDMSAADFKTAMSGVMLCYELATPGTPFIVDGPDPATLLGDNNVWADTGDVSVVYRADTGLYIAKKIAEVTA